MKKKIIPKAICLFLGVSISLFSFAQNDIDLYGNLSKKEDIRLSKIAYDKSIPTFSTHVFRASFYTLYPDPNFSASHNPKNLS